MRVRNLVARVSADGVFRIFSRPYVLEYAPSCSAHRPHVQKAFDHHRRTAEKDDNL